MSSQYASCISPLGASFLYGEKLPRHIERAQMYMRDPNAVITAFLEKFHGASSDMFDL